MKKKFISFELPKKSLFGFKVLNSTKSTFFAYFFLILYLISFNFHSQTKIELIAKFLYIFICNLSFLILIINSYTKRFEIKKYIFYTLNFPLIIVIPLSTYIVIKSLISIIYILSI